MTEKIFDKIYNDYYNDVFKLAYSYTMNFQEAEDILQKVFVKLYKREQMFFQPDIDIKKWLMKVTTNECKDYYRLSFFKKKSMFSDLDIATEYFFNDDFLCQLNQLNIKYRLVLYLYYYQGYQIQEISSILNIGVSSVKQRLKRGKEKLKLIMEGDN